MVSVLNFLKERNKTTRSYFVKKGIYLDEHATKYITGLSDIILSFFF